MATKRDLVEADAFCWRRLVTAFLSGAPDGREVEPSRPGPPVVGAVALGVVLAAAAAVSGIVSGHHVLGPFHAGGSPQGFGTITEELAGPWRFVATSRTTYSVRTRRAVTEKTAAPLASSRP
jgi:hypothetical protein